MFQTMNRTRDRMFEVEATDTDDWMERLAWITAIKARIDPMVQDSKEDLASSEGAVHGTMVDKWVTPISASVSM